MIPSLLFRGDGHTPARRAQRATHTGAFEPSAPAPTPSRQDDGHSTQHNSIQEYTRKEIDEAMLHIPRPTWLAAAPQICHEGVG